MLLKKSSSFAGIEIDQVAVAESEKALPDDLVENDQLEIAIATG